MGLSVGVMCEGLWVGIYIDGMNNVGVGVGGVGRVDGVLYLRPLHLLTPTLLVATTRRCQTLRMLHVAG